MERKSPGHKFLTFFEQVMQELTTKEEREVDASKGDGSEQDEGKSESDGSDFLLV